MALSPIWGLVVLILLELAYLSAILIPYHRHRHLKTILLLIPRVLQSLLMMIL